MLQEEWDADVVFPKKWRETIDRAIRYVDFIGHKIGHPPLPVQYYRFYNNSGVPVIPRNNRPQPDAPVYSLQ